MADWLVIGIDTATVTEDAKVETWHWFSVDQAIAAASFARRTRELETATPKPGDVLHEHRSAVIASLLASAGFLEALLNEFWASAEHPALEVGGALPDPARMALAGSFPSIDRLPLLDKYQLALTFCGKAALDRGAQPYQDAELVMGLRNALVHYRPAWREAGRDGLAPITKWECALAAKHFALNPFTGAGSPFFPDKCLGYGCCEWAWSACLAIADEFFSRVGVTPVHEHVRDELTL